MAVVNGIMGGSLTGSVGKVTFRKGVKGDTIASQKAEKVRNPQTYEQMYQRMSMNTAMKAYSVMKSICDHSFEGVQYGEKSMSYFIKKNLAGMNYGFSNVANSKNFGFTAKGELGGVAPRPFLVSDGSLQSFHPRDVQKVDLTWGDWKKATRMKEGDQLTIIALISAYDLSSEDFDSERQVQFDFVYARYLFKDKIEDTTKVFNAEYISNDVLQDVEDPGDTALVLRVIQGEAPKIDYLSSSLHVNGYACIVSRKSGSIWKRSTANMVWNGIPPLPECYTETKAIATYNPKSPKFLNKAESKI